jgi:hypothetical protein
VRKVRPVGRVGAEHLTASFGRGSVGSWRSELKLGVEICMLILKSIPFLAPFLIGATLFLLTTQLYPPGARDFTWLRFIADHAPVAAKVAFLAKTYLAPAVLSFTWIASFQLAMRARKSSLAFVMIYIAAISMFTAWRSLALGPSRLPGYALGIAIAQTMASRLVAVTKPERLLFGRKFRIYKVVWAGDKDAVAQLRRQMQSQAQQPSPR